MIDREKVIKGLNCCCQTDGYDCSKCPYNIADSDCTALLSMDVLALLKEQEPRVLTLSEALEAVSKDGGYVWIEEKIHPCETAHIYPSSSIPDCQSRRYKDYGKEFIPTKYSSRFMWRCWNSWPKDEEKKAVKWE